MNSPFNKPYMAIIILGTMAVFSSGCSHLKTGEFPKLLSGINPAARRDAPTMFASARQLELEGDSESALRTYRETVKRFPNHGPSHHRLAVNLDRSGKPEMAAPHYQIALQLLPNDSELLCDCGYSLYLQGNDEMAARFLSAAIEQDPGNQRAHNNLGMVHARLGDASAAVEHFSRAGCNHRQAMANLKILTPNATLEVAPMQMAQMTLPPVTPVNEPEMIPSQIARTTASLEPIVREATKPDPLRLIPNARPIDGAKQLAKQAMLAMNLVPAADIHLAAYTTQPDNESTKFLSDVEVTGPVTFILNDQTIAEFK